MTTTTNDQSATIAAQAARIVILEEGVREMHALFEEAQAAGAEARAVGILSDCFVDASTKVDSLTERVEATEALLTFLKTASVQEVAAWQTEELLVPY